VRGAIRGAVIAAVLTVGMTVGCGSDSADSDDGGGSDGTGGCTGELSGDVTLVAAGDVGLPGGGSAGIGSVFSDDDPPHISLIVGPASAEEQEAAQHLELGDTFTVEGTSYTVQGFCEDKAYLAQAAG
jgi:hypothetical protein